MSDYYDQLETRDPELRATGQFTALPDLIASALAAPGWAKQLAGVDPGAVTTRSGLAKLPLLRKSDLVVLQKAQPPFGGFNVMPPNRMRRLLMSPGPIFEPQGGDPDLYGMTRAL